MSILQYVQSEHRVNIRGVRITYKVNAKMPIDGEKVDSAKIEMRTVGANTKYVFCMNM